jgi:hypothetical protein
MTPLDQFKSQRGATRLGFLDVVTALILLGILLFAAYKQFPVYQPASSSSSSTRK